MTGEVEQKMRRAGALLAAGLLLAGCGAVQMRRTGRVGAGSAGATTALNVALPAGPKAGIWDSSRSVAWILVNDSGTIRLFSLDPATQAVSKGIIVGDARDWSGAGLQLETASDALYAAAGGAVDRVDLKSGTVETFPVPGVTQTEGASAQSALLQGGRLYVSTVGSTLVQQLDIETGTWTKPLEVGLYPSLNTRAVPDGAGGIVFQGRPDNGEGVAAPTLALRGYNPNSGAISDMRLAQEPLSLFTTQGAVGFVTTSGQVGRATLDDVVNYSNDTLPPASRNLPPVGVPGGVEYFAASRGLHGVVSVTLQSDGSTVSRLIDFPLKTGIAGQGSRFNQQASAPPMAEYDPRVTGLVPEPNGSTLVLTESGDGAVGTSAAYSAVYLSQPAE